MSKRLGIKVFLNPVQWVKVSPRKQPVSFASHRARIFCSECNTHFKHLEDAAIPLLVPMARGDRQLVLGSDEQGLLAQWAAKTGFALIAATAPELRDLVPVDHRRSVREYGFPPDDDLWIAYLPWAGSVHVFGGDVQIVDGGVTPPLSFQAYSSVFTFGKLAFKILGFIDHPSGYILDGDMPSIRQVWPQKSSFIDWPPWGPPATDGHIQGVLDFKPLVRPNPPPK